MLEAIRVAPWGVELALGIVASLVALVLLLIVALVRAAHTGAGRKTPLSIAPEIAAVIACVGPMAIAVQGWGEADAMLAGGFDDRSPISSGVSAYAMTSMLVALGYGLIGATGGLVLGLLAYARIARHEIPAAPVALFLPALAGISLSILGAGGVSTLLSQIRLFKALAVAAPASKVALLQAGLQEARGGLETAWVTALVILAASVIIGAVWVERSQVRAKDPIDGLTFGVLALIVSAALWLEAAGL